ncbi:MAG: hemolysin family protein, partial [Nitriliruptorales bacterium]|nr:hemolysin family protein [Nitriliruptorales bacterium]
MDPGVALAVAALLVVMNGLFVAAEFALVATRRGLIEERAEAGDARARMVLRELRQLSFVLSAAQFGITATSLVVGFLAEDALGELFVRPAMEALGLPDQTVTAVSVTVALLLASVVQMLFGELAPKNLAIARPEPVALRLARFMRAFGVLFGPVIRIFDRAAAWTSQHLLRVEFSEELVGAHSVDELSRIIAVSGEQGSLTEAQAELLARAVELGDTRVHEIMVPRPDVYFLGAEDGIQALRDAARRTGHSRFPVRGETGDDVLGTVHIKDVLQVEAHEEDELTLGAIATAALVVPESELVRRLLAQFRSRQRTFAVVVDEYGGTAGIVTIEDVLEQLVGDIVDEFDQ